MPEKKWKQDISDILDDDLATRESIDPGAILRPDLTMDRAGAGDEPASDTWRPPLPLEDPKEGAPPELFANSSETRASLPPEPVGPAPSPRPRSRRAPRPKVASPEKTPNPVSAPEPSTGRTPEAIPSPAAGPDPESRTDADVGPDPSSAPRPGPDSARRKPRSRQPGAGGGSGSHPRSDQGGEGGQPFTDSVTILEISAPEEGGIHERPLPGDRSLSPPSPPEARRHWNHPAARWTSYVVVVVVLTVLFLFLLVDIFHLG